MTATALLTDLYQLTMAYGYWRAGRHDDEAVFHLFFRRPPFGGGYALACGLEPAIDYARSGFTVTADLSRAAGGHTLFVYARSAITGREAVVSFPITIGQ